LKRAGIGFESLDRIELHEPFAATVLGIQAWIREHVAKARQLAAAEEDPEIRANLLDMASMNEQMIDEPPRTFQGACQFISWVAMVTRMFNGAGGIGQLDELLEPFYRRDVEAGVLDDEEAIFHLICMFLIDTQYYQLGGPGPDGRDRTSRVSFLVLEALHRMKTTSNVTVRVWEGLDEQLFDLSVRYLFEDRNGSPRFMGEKGMTEGFMRNGYTREFAHAPISHGANPDPGFKDAGAATAMATALLSVQCGYGNTVPLQMELDPGIIRQEDGIEKMKALIRTYCELGGTLMNLNVLSREQVLEAHRDPTKYPALIVRVTGFSAYFRMLSEEFRQLVVDRIVSER
jgi:pyruvate-formate lyase